MKEGKESKEETAIVENGAGKKPCIGRREKMEKENKKYEEEREETKEWRRSLFIEGSTPGHTLNGEKKITKIIFLFSLSLFPFPTCLDFYLDYLLGWCFNLPVSWDSLSSLSWFLYTLIILSPQLLFALFLLSILFLSIPSGKKYQTNPHLSRSLIKKTLGTDT